MMRRVHHRSILEIGELRQAVAIAGLLLLFAVRPAIAQDNWHDPQPHDECAMCHAEHFSQSHSWSGAGPVGTTPQPDGDWIGSGPNAHILRAPADEMCTSCHNGSVPTVPATSNARAAATSAQPSVRSFNSISEWTRSAHASAPPSAARGDDWRSGRCVNCHDPHGVRDEKGLIPASLRTREPQLCLGCHDNPQTGDVLALMNRPYVHGAQSRGTHDPNEAADPVRFAAAPQDNRHAACSDCHNSHEGSRDPAPSLSPFDALVRLAGVSRVEAVNGGAGVAPSYRFHAADERDRDAEYEVCFKCHSSWTRQPAGQPDLARLTNPANPSFHPVQGEGRNRGIADESFTNGYTASSRVACSDCHGSDDPKVRGPHGSIYPYLLKKPTSSGAMAEPLTAADLCFDCHAYAVYGDPLANADTQRASRFNAPSVAGHAFHSGVKRIACWACHETHGSTRLPSLIATRPQGIVSYTQNAMGGTCVSGCHELKTWNVNYRR